MKTPTKYFFLVCMTAVFLNSCDKYLDPQVDNRLTEEQMMNDPVYFEGLLLRVYAMLPSAYNFNDDVISDDAVTNLKSSNYLRMATGEWKSTFYPNSQWEMANEAIFYVNYFLSNYEEVAWSHQDTAENKYHLQRLKGEAYGLRALWEFKLLQHHAGETAAGDLMGFPMITEAVDANSNLQIPRSTYGDCVDQILADIDTAIANLPDSYSDKDPGVPENLPYNAAFGQRFMNRLTGTALKVLKTRVLLYAASPAFEYISWEKAATDIGNIIRLMGGGAYFVNNGLEFYKDMESSEIIWANAYSNSNSLERNNYPPSEYGSGRTNPTQNLVDAFPMINGFPIDDPSSGYDPQNPYADRDPRLSTYILHHEGVLKDTMYTDISSEDGTSVLETSTRSGYYLKKFMVTNVNLTPGSVTNAEHFYTYFRRTELFLNYAEAANEAWGPDEDPKGFGFTPRSFIGQIRTRAGLPILIFDNYMKTINDKDSFRELVRTERRIELCFEGHRFWDLRRWGLTEAISEPVDAMRIDFSSETPYQTEFLETRDYKEFMIYGPIPYEETLKYSLEQNKGW